MREYVNLFMDIAEALLKSGAEIYRVEETLMRLGSAYGAYRTDVFAITSNIELTMVFKAEQYTLVRRIRSSGSDFTRLNALNTLARAACKSRLSAEEIRNSLNKINAGRLSPYKKCAGGFLGASAFSVFFGGSLWDALVAGLIGVFISVIMLLGAKKISSRAAMYVLCSLPAGFLSCLAAAVFGLSADKIIIGVIMLMIPGLAVTNSVRDMLVGDTLSGLLRLIQSIIETIMIAGCFLVALRATGLAVTHSQAADGYEQLIPALLGSLGFALMSNVERKYLFASTIGGLLAWLLFIFAENILGFGTIMCAFIASFASELAAEGLARIYKAPATVFLLGLVIPMVPGGALFNFFSTLIAGDAAYAGYGISLLLMLGGITLGIGVAASLVAYANKRL